MHRFRIRLIFALIASVTIVSVAFTYLDVLAHRHVLRQELDSRTQWMGRSILPSLEQALATGDIAKIIAITESEKKSTESLGSRCVRQSGPDAGQQRRRGYSPIRG